MWRIVIAGGGFGGLYAARALERAMPPHAARVTLVTDTNFMLYTPLLPGAAGASLEPRHVVVPLRQQLPRTELRLGQVTGADPDRRVVLVRSAEGQEVELEYDALVVALGSVSRTLPVPGLAEHAVGFKTIAEAIALRNRLVQSFEKAETIDDDDVRAEYLSFVFTGAGYAGLEALAELQDYATDVIGLYPRCAAHGMRWVLVEARERVMGEVPADLAEFAARELRARGVEIRTSTRVEEITATSTRLSDGETIPTRTFVWTAGVKPHPVIARLGLPLEEHGRIKVDRLMRVEGQDRVWAIGDGAAVPDPARPGHPCPPTAQHALRQGTRVGKNVAAALGNGQERPFRYKTRGVFVDLGRQQAVASTFGLKWRGFPAWFLARTYHLVFLPGIGRKARLVTDWTVGLLFGRDASELGQLGQPTPIEVTVPEQGPAATAPAGPDSPAGNGGDGDSSFRRTSGGVSAGADGA